MSSEVCPFCGKTYKRLKSHLPHCKAAASSKTPATKNERKQKTSSQLDAAPSEPAAKGKTSTQTPSMSTGQQSKSKKSPVVLSAPPQSSSLSSALPSPSTKKKKQRLSEEIKTANIPSSPTSLSPTISEPKRKSLRSLIEAAKSKQVPKASLEGTSSASDDQPSDSTPFVSDHLSSNSTAQKETKTDPDKDAHPASADTKPKAASTMKSKKDKTKKAKPLSTSRDGSSSLDSKVNKSSARPRDFWMDDEGDNEDLSASKMPLKLGSGRQARITLQDVKATLGRANSTRQSGRPSILSQLQTTDDLSSKIRLGTSLSPVPLPTGNHKDLASCLATAKPLQDQLPIIRPQHTQLQSVSAVSSKPKQASLIPRQHDGSPQPAAPLLSGRLSSQVSQTTTPPRTGSVDQGLKVGHHMTGLLTVSTSPLMQFSHLVPQTLPVRVETLGGEDWSKLKVRKHNTADISTKGALTQRSLGQVRLKELPEWLACKAPGHPRDVLEMVQRGWQWYYRRYIDVRKGGVGGLAMLLAGYCVLSYIWSYPHIKRDRWRKYH
ncbi:mitochondrial nucleoid-associated protein 1 [Pempheris klunzingeri]|uniref:mitochondrial nucleoid-associated protein 1 n=1 Tax=Pempheris klunzingeri TaxID=3127111 RepID=UPI00397F7934